MTKVMSEILVSCFSALCSLLGLIAFLVGFITPWWLQAPSLDGTAGLWRHCAGDNCTGLVDVHIGDWLVACQALAITALLTAFLTLGLAVFMVKASRQAAPSTRRYGVIATSLLTGLTITVTLLIYYFQHHQLYSLHLYSISTSIFLFLAGGAFFFVEAIVLSIYSLTVKTCYSVSSIS